MPFIGRHRVSKSGSQSLEHGVVATTSLVHPVDGYVGALDQQASKISVAAACDAERDDHDFQTDFDVVAAEIAANISTSSEPLSAAKRVR